MSSNNNLTVQQSRRIKGQALARIDREQKMLHSGTQGPREGANKRGNSSRLTQSFHFFMFEPIFSPVNALNQPI